jgi:hypothetical protein
MPAHPIASEAPITEATPAPAHNQADFIDAAAVPTAHTTSGWDPYEIWRTRIFMPANLPQNKRR